MRPTDIFLGAFKGRPRVTLLGAPTGGGSGRSLGYELRISSMASLTPAGRLYDGNGIEPDARVDPTPRFFIGGEDRQLQEALKRLRK